MAKSYEEMVDEAKSKTEQVGVEEVHEALESGEDVTILDAREPDEWEEGHIKGAKLIPRSLLELKAADELPEEGRRIFVHCAVGGRGALAAETLQEIGYINVTSMEGSINAWREKGYETE